MYIIKDDTTKESRIKRSKIKDKKYKAMLKEISYRDEGELFMKAIQNQAFERLKLKDNFYEIICK